MNNATVNLSRTRCAVLGAGGFIGTNLCRALVGRVDSLRAFGRRQSFPEALRGCDWMPGDFADPTCMAAAVAGCDVVFHLVNATTPASANVDKVADLNANVASTLHLLDACRETGVKRVVFVSSGGTIYGIPEQVPTPETSPTNPITAYGIGKLAIEKYLGLYEYLYGLEYRVLRVANPFGPFQTALKNQGVIAAFVRRALAGKPIEIWGDGSVTRDYVYIDDVVEALMLAATHDGSGRIFNIGSGEGRSLNDIVASISKLLEVEIPVDHRPSRPVDVPVSILDTTFASRDLDWRPRTVFEEGLSTTISWMESIEVA
ncbi:NAD-dependent epimerase/dehydratase family protein [Herbaspirillum aquaticum]|uniref:NAD-dependent epimerase/dehydratase family protein n=1 Tax=Herbaspirillum aquaticum TaxID=568783 RepID=UPI0024DEA227|nr:NAD-dependent epimerase/dehydratase family protein [Herbaspirillum aquaticum]